MKNTGQLFACIFGTWVFMCGNTAHVRTIIVDVRTWACPHVNASMGLYI